jgi:parallel beta-helix repeat protein
VGFYSDDNTLVGNNISGNLEGIALGNIAEDNFIFDNTIADNVYYGIGIWYWNTGNEVVHNNFINNTAFARASNVWDHGYPSGGNYWSDYGGKDVFSGPYQNVTGSDGIGDTPYTLPDSIIDHYPLMQPWIGQSLNVTSSYGLPTPSSDWFMNGTSIVESVSSPLLGPSGVQHVCTGWTGTGSIPSSGSASSVTFTITQASSITWNWETQEYLTVTSPYESSSNMSGWFDDGTSITESVNSPITLSGARYSGTRYVCTGWSGTGSVPASGTVPSVNFVISAPSTITWNWNTTNICDLDNSGTVNMKDVGIAAKAFGTAPCDSRWNAIADVSGPVGTPDGSVDMRDIALIAKNFGWTVTNP